MRQLKSKSVLCGLFLTAIAVASAGCSSVTTSAKLRDPSQTSVSFRRVGRTSIRPIDPGTADVSVNLASLDVKQAATIRRENQAILLDCAQCVDGNFALLSDSGLTGGSPIGVSELNETRNTKKDQLSLNFEYEVSSSQSLYPVLDTKWTNVEYFQENREPNRTLGWLLAPGGFLTAMGVYFLISGEPLAGIGFMLPGLALDTWGAWQLIMSPSVERLGLDGKPMPVPVASSEPTRASEEATPEKDTENESLEEKTLPPTEAKKAPAARTKAQEPKKADKEADKKEPEKKVEKPAEEKPEKASKKEQSKAEEDESPKKETKPAKSKKKENLDDFLL
jgi:hypothetical protein